MEFESSLRVYWIPCRCIRKINIIKVYIGIERQKVESLCSWKNFIYIVPYMHVRRDKFVLH